MPGSSIWRSTLESADEPLRQFSSSSSSHLPAVIQGLFKGILIKGLFKGIFIQGLFKGIQLIKQRIQRKFVCIFTNFITILRINVLLLEQDYARNFQ